MKNAKDDKKKSGSKKKIIVAILIIVVIALMSKKADAATLPMLPALPYVPPSRVQIWDLINNIFGLTKLNISDEQKRLQAYENLLRQYVSDNDIEEIVQNAREARKMQIKAGVRDGLQQYMLYQIQTGVEEVITPTPIDVQGTYNKLLQWQYITEQKLPYATYQTMYNNALSALGTNIIILCTYITKGVDNTLVIGFVKNEGTYTFHTSRQSIGGYSGLSSVWKKNGTTNAYQCVVYGQNGGGSWSRGNNPNSAWFGFDNAGVCTSTQYGTSGFTTYTYTTKGESYMRKATAQSAAITTALQNSSDIPLTASSQYVNGTLDTTQDIVTTLPATLPQAASDIQDLPAVQEQLGVLPAPISQDIEQSITQLQEQQAAQYGDTGEYAIDLTQLFPFCLPFDIYRILVAFEAEPETPQIHFELVNPWSNGENAEKWEAELDLSRFDGVAALVRKLELLLYCVGLAMITRSVFLRG